jgi:hypothetical protein
VESERGRPPVERRGAPVVSDLLRQPGGFEGRGLGAEQPIAHELAALNRGHLPVTDLYLDAAAPAAPKAVGQEDNLVALGDALVDLGVEVREAAPEAREVPLQTGDSFIGRLPFPCGPRSVRLCRSAR